MRASYDGRDFGKFELVLSDTTIHQTYKDGEQVTVTPNEISIVGVYEYEGVVRHDYKGGKIHNKYVSGLDIYYCIDSEEIYTEYNSSMTEVPDKNNDG
jgi:hypothetical protein